MTVAAVTVSGAVRGADHCSTLCKSGQTAMVLVQLQIPGKFFKCVGNFFCLFVFQMQ